MSQLIELELNTFAATPGAPTVTQQGSAGTTAYSYKIVGVAGDGTLTAASSAGSVADGAATLNGTDFNRVTWTKVPGTVTYKVYRTASAGTPSSTGLIGTVAQPGGSTATFDDTGFAGDSATPSASNGTGIGEAADVTHLQAIAVQYGGTFVATFQLQESINGVDWANLGSTVNSASVVQLSGSRAFLRAKMTAYTSGSPTVDLMGYVP